MREFITDLKSFFSNFAPGSWAKALGIALICLTSLVVAMTIADSIARFYLYSFDQDPKRWTNLSVFYARPRQSVIGRTAPVHLGSLVVRGNNGNPAFASRYELNLADVKPSALHDCLLAAEDKRFYRHAGLDYFGVAKAVFDHYVAGERLRGGSTISNQLVRTVILADQSRSIWRKIPEIVLTSVAERHFSKDDLLLVYVNNVPVGHLGGRALIGLSVASEVLFGKKDPKALTLSEACVLAGMLNRPNAYLKDMQKGDYRRIARKRDIVLANLRRSNPERYSEEAISRAKREKIRFSTHGKNPAREPRQFIGYAYQQVQRKKSGLDIYLTLNPDLQRAAEGAVNSELARFDRGPYGFSNQISYRHAISQGLKATEEESKLQAALVALDPKTGEILAMVGGREKSEFNRATQSKRAPGSIIKPFVYLYAMSAGNSRGQPFGPDTVIDPAASAVAQRYSTGGPDRAIVQLARSDNGAAIALAEQFGVPRVRDFIAKVTGAKPVGSELVAIGAGKGMELSPLEVATAYTVFANDGVKVASKPIFAVYDGDRKLQVPETKPIRIVNADAATTVTRMLGSVVGDGPDGHYGTARMARKISTLDVTVPLAGKTGTGDNDLWFVGFTPRLVVVAWVGFDNNHPTFEASKGFTGAGLPLQIWARFMKDMKSYRPDLLKGSFDLQISATRFRRQLLFWPDI